MNKAPRRPRDKRYQQSEKGLAMHKAARQRHKRKVADEFFAWKQSFGCIQCGYNAHGAALDFDHTVPSTRSYKITASNWKTARGQEEIMKCDMLCANCHRIKTCNERRADPNWKSIPRRNN